MKKKIYITVLIVFIILILILAVSHNPSFTHSAKDFGFEELKSKIDFNNNGTDDYTDIMLGARNDAKNHPKYDGRYFDGGYPPDDIGVCTDVVWRGFKNAGYSLKDMIDRDIKNFPEDYHTVKEPDPNIDFRRVKNLHIFFSKYCTELTTDINKIEEWQQGDIVIFENDKHIGIVSDKRNSKGQTYIIHNGGQLSREEDMLHRATVTAHYRFDASLIDSSVLKEWKN